MEKVYLVMPAYNEAKNIEETIRQWYPVVVKLSAEGEARLVIANDGSKDDTYAIMQRLRNGIRCWSLWISQTAAMVLLCSICIDMQ